MTLIIHCTNKIVYSGLLWDPINRLLYSLGVQKIIYCTSKTRTNKTTDHFRNKRWFCKIDKTLPLLMHIGLLSHLVLKSQTAFIYLNDNLKLNISQKLTNLSHNLLLPYAFILCLQQISNSDAIAISFAVYDDSILSIEISDCGSAVIIQPYQRPMLFI